MKKKEIIILILISILTAILVFIPHLNYPYPLHIDEWHHIIESKKIQNGDYTGSSIGYRIGFHIFLLILSYFFNLIEIFQFLPAIWAVFSGLALFILVYGKTKNFALGAWSMLFFASIKSNVNITGLWFFTSLTFSIPFIFLYILFFTEGLEKHNKKYLLTSLAIMIFLVFVHSISVLFMIPPIIIYLILNKNHVLKEKRILSAFITLPIIGLIFYKTMTNISFSKIIPSLIENLTFEYGWGILELQNSFLEIYSPIGIILAILGTLIFFITLKEPKKLIIFLLWPAWLLIDIYIYRKTGVSYLTPYQRNFYYFALSLPFLSALGMNFIIDKIKSIKLSENAIKTLIIITSMIILILTFKSYTNIPEQIEVYHLIDESGMDALSYLKNYPPSKIMAPLELSSTAYAISGQDIVSAVSFYGNRNDVISFYYEFSCKEKDLMLENHKVAYIISETEYGCNWKEIYKNERYIVYEAPN
jgi:hypothetical protein